MFLDSVHRNISRIRDVLSPETRIDIDEVGVALDDRHIDETPPVFWNAANALFAYIFGKLAVSERVDVVGQSFLIGYPDRTQSQFPASPERIDGFAASISMLNWTTGSPNAKYWGLKLLIDHLEIGDGAVSMEMEEGSDRVFVQGFSGKNGESQRERYCL